MAPLPKFGQGELPDERVSVLLQGGEGPSAYLLVAVPTQFDEPGVEFGKPAGGKDPEQVDEYRRLAG